MKTICQALCLCCFRFSRHKKKNKKKNSIRISNDNESGTPLIERSNNDKKRNDSEDCNDTPFSKENVMKRINKELSNRDDYEQFYSKDNLSLAIKKSGSENSRQLPVIKMVQYLNKKDLPSHITIRDLCQYMNSPEIRLKWDKSIKDYKIIKEKDDKSYILHSILKKPVFFISERDLVVQRYDFYDGTTFYFFAQSITDETVPEISDVVRIEVIYNGYKIHEEKDRYCFSSLAQMDFKMNLPQSVFKVTMPTALHQWFKSLKQKINSEHSKL